MSTAHNEHMQSALPIFYATTKMRKLQLALTNAHKNQRSAVSPLLSLDLELHRNHRHRRDNSRHRDHAREPIPESLFETITQTNESHVSTDGARIQKNPLAGVA